MTGRGGRKEVTYVLVVSKLARQVFTQVSLADQGHHVWHGSCEWTMLRPDDMLGNLCCWLLVSLDSLPLS